MTSRGAMQFFGSQRTRHTMLALLLRTMMSQRAAQALESSGGATREAPPADSSGLIGTTLEGSYRIVRLIAEGGMSAVYEAVQLRLSQRVAVKVMARELAANPEALARFRREAEITSRLRHPHLVTVMDFGTAPAGQPYLVMEYLEGIDLDRRIREHGRLPLATVVHITKQVASALAAAHGQGIVHRDLKPANVFLVELPGEPDFAKILDFGVSKVRAASTQLTKARSVIGTPNYMSPEQATGMLDEVDHRTDQWALACIAWEMLSGRPAFASDDISAVFYQVIHLDPKPLAKRAPEVPAAVEAVLRRALSKSIEERFLSVMDFANALAEAASSLQAHATVAVQDPSQGAPQVDRRRRQERRRATDLAAQPREDRRKAPSPGRLAKLKWAHLAAALAATVAFAAVVSLRAKRSRDASAIRAPATALKTLAPAATPPSPPAGATHTPPETPVRLATETGPSHAATPAEPPRALPEARLAGASDTLAPAVPSKRLNPRPGRRSAAHDDFVDPFAPERPSSRPGRARAGRPDSEFVDPFGP